MRAAAVATAAAARCGQLRAPGRPPPSAQPHTAGIITQQVWSGREDNARRWFLHVTQWKGDRQEKAKEGPSPYCHRAQDELDFTIPFPRRACSAPLPAPWSATPPAIPTRMGPAPGWAAPEAG